MRHNIRGAAGMALGLVFLATALARAQELPKLPALDKILKPEQTAIVMVDFQNNFVAPKGEHYAQMEKQYRETHVIDNAIDLVKRARGLGVQVIQVIEGYSDDYRELDWGNGADFHRAQIVRQAWKSSDWNTALYEPMKSDKDIVLSDRKTLNGFGGNGLDTILKSRGIRNVAVGGFTADVCVYATTLAGYDLGYRMFALTDAIVSADAPLTKEMMRYLYPKVSRPMTSDSFLAMVPGKQAATTDGKD
jgi:ureidoacrylate peracid hydrolase